MPSNKKTSILAIYEILKKYSDGNHCLKQKEILNILERDYDIQIDRRTLYSNMNYLTDFGYEISKYHEGKTGYYLKTRDYTPNEIYFLCNILYASASIPQDETERISNKLLSELSVFQRDNFNKYNLRINDIKTYSSEYCENINKILNTIESRNLLRFIVYRNVVDKNLFIRKISKTVLVCPLSIVYFRERMYLLTCDRDGSNISHHRLVNIKNIEVISENYPDNLVSEEDIEDYKIRMSFSDKGNIKVRLIVDMKLLENLIDYFGDQFKIISSSEEKMEIILEATEKNIIDTTMKYAKYIELVEPGYLRTKIKQILEESAAKYGGCL